MADFPRPVSELELKEGLARRMGVSQPQQTTVMPIEDVHVRERRLQSNPRRESQARLG